MGKSGKYKVIFLISCVLFIIQMLRAIIKKIAFVFVGKSFLLNDLITILIMTIFIILMLSISKKKNINLCIKPELKSKASKIRYFIITVIVILLIVLNPGLYGGSLELITSIVLSVIVTPIFEELLFRGYIWEELKKCYKSEMVVYIINTVLFSLWHIGYVDSLILKVGNINNIYDIIYIIFMKVLVGLGFGVVIGIIRYKTKNCYATILAHSIMNTFGR